MAAVGYRFGVMNKTKKMGIQRVIVTTRVEKGDVKLRWHRMGIGLEVEVAVLRAWYFALGI